jgi:hypothetical protein
LSSGEESEHSHKKIVKDILPCFANKLKKEGIISNYDRKPFNISVSEDVNTHHWPLLRIIPDCVLYLLNKGKVLVEIVNPEGEPKRCIGELVYPYLLGYHKKIVAALVFMLPPLKGKANVRRVELNIELHKICEKQIPTQVWTWNPSCKDTNYHNLKEFLTKKVLPIKY